ncbi:hypothetical protein QFZ28_005832 [Neobacillus niacini]|nr:hypothetical protein [Neobacillus niacini]
MAIYKNSKGGMYHVEYRTSVEWAIFQRVSPVANEYVVVV